jgi:transposase
LGISRTTVRKYLKHPEAVIRKPRAQQPSKLDPFHEQIKQWVMQDHCTNCEVLFVRLQKLGYTGGISILKGYVHPLRPAIAGHAPVQRYETKPGEQVWQKWEDVPCSSIAMQKKMSLPECLKWQLRPIRCSNNWMCCLMTISFLRKSKWT